MLFRNDLDRAIAFAAMKTLERTLEKEPNLPPGYSVDVSGCSITITLPNESIVERDAGLNDDGIIEKTATQNIYGYATWALMIQKLRKFKQWNSVKNLLKETVSEVLDLEKRSKHTNTSVRELIALDFPDLADEMDQIKEDLSLPKRVEQTPKQFRNKAPAMFSFKKK